MATPLLLLGWLAASGPASAAEAGATITEGIAVHLPPAGLDALGVAVAGAMPTALSIEASSGELACAESDATPLSWSLDPLDLTIAIDDVAIQTADGTLSLLLSGALGSTVSQLTATGDCSVLTDLDEVCGVELPTTAFSAALQLDLELVDGEVVVAATDPVVTISPILSPLSDCSLASAFNSIIYQNPTFLSDLLLDLLQPELAGLGATLEDTVAGAVGGLVIETELDLLGVTASVAVEPTLLTVDERGIVLGLGGGVVPDALSSCVDSSAGAVLSEEGGWPDFGNTAAGSSLPHDAAVWVGADFADQALYNLWAAGLLCIDAQAFAADLGVTLNAEIVDGLVGGGFVDLYGEGAPVELLVVPRTPPTVRLGDDQPPLTIDPGDLALELWSELEQRKVRVFSANLEVQPGVDVYLNDAGALTVDLLFSIDDLRLVEAYSETLDPGWSDGLFGLLDTLVPGLLPANPLLDVALPAPLGIGIGPLTWLTDDAGDWLGGFLLVDTSTVTPLELPGCSLDGIGCDGGVEVDLDLDALLGCDADSAGLGCSGADGAGCDEGAACATATDAETVLQRVGLGRLAMFFALFVGVASRRLRA